MKFFILENTIVDKALFKKGFICDLEKCKGACCVEGTYGAPLEAEEIVIIEDALPAVRPYMTDGGKALLEEKGFWEKDPDGELVTTTIERRDCVFAINEEGIYKCAIEKAHNEGKTDFKKPISCHLYPIRVEKLENGMEQLNYNKWYLCHPACKLGEKLKVPIYRFLKESITRKFGEQYYNTLDELADHIDV